MPRVKIRHLRYNLLAAVNRGLLFSLVLVLGVISGQAAAHEFWIEPESHRVAPGEAIRADLKVGKMLKGDYFPYLKKRFLSYRVTVGARTVDVQNYEGASPSLDITADQPGLRIITYHSTADRLVYRDWQKFLTYAEQEGMMWAVEAHKARGLPESGFSEIYSRGAKALVQVGKADAADRDRAVGLPLELIAGENPFADKTPTELPVQLLWRGQPIGDTQISIFRNNGTITRQIVRTDATGRAMIPLNGGGRFLLNAIHLQPVAASDAKDDWESHWASLTFAVTAKSQ